MHFCQLSRNWVLKLDLGTHLRDNRGHLVLWDLELFWRSLKVGQTKLENMHFCRISQNWNFKSDLDTHLRDEHGHLFLWDLEVFWPSFEFAQTKVENMHFCRLPPNWVLKVVLGTHLKVHLSTHLREKHGHLFLWYLELFFPSFKGGQTKVENMRFCRHFHNWVLKVDLATLLRDKHGHLFVWDLDFGPHSRLVKQRLKICTFVDFLRIEFWKWI